MRTNLAAPIFYLLATACASADPGGPAVECGAPLAADLATDRPWPDAVTEWALARPADSLVQPEIRYRSEVLEGDRARVTAAGGRVVYQYRGQPLLSVEFSAADLATFAGGNRQMLDERIESVQFGLSTCPAGG